MAVTNNELPVNKRRRVPDVSPVAPAIKQQGSDHKLKWDTIAPANIAEWFEVYAKVNNLTQDILLASVVPTVARLMRQIAIKVGSRLKTEQVNLFIICLRAPGSGKSPAFKKCLLAASTTASGGAEVDDLIRSRIHRSWAVSATKRCYEPQMHHGKKRTGFTVYGGYPWWGKKEGQDRHGEAYSALQWFATWVYTKGNQSLRQEQQSDRQ